MQSGRLNQLVAVAVKPMQQAFAVLLPTVRSVGVMGDHRTYENLGLAVESLGFRLASEALDVSGLRLMVRIVVSTTNYVASLREKPCSRAAGSRFRGFG